MQVILALEGEIKLTVYADILFLVNLSLNWFSILLTARIMKLKIKPLKMLLAAALGALCGIVTLFFENTLIVTLSEIASAFMMSAIAFSADRFLYYIKICTCLFASGITIGGSLTLIYSLFNRCNIELQKQSDLSTAFFLLLSLFVTLVAVVFEKTVLSSKKQVNGKIVIEYDKKSKEFDFFCDSGNFLSDPLSGKPAIIVPANELEGLLPENVLSFSPIEPGALCKQHKGMNRIRLLPASSVCGSSIMTGFIPDRITVVTKKLSKEVDAVIAIDRESKKYSHFKALMPITLV